MREGERKIGDMDGWEVGGGSGGAFVFVVVGRSRLVVELLSCAYPTTPHHQLPPLCLFHSMFCCPAFHPSPSKVPTLLPLLLLNQSNRLCFPHTLPSMADPQPQSQTLPPPLPIDTIDTTTTTAQTPPEKPPRKFPAPCWTQEETLALIESYRDRWYALRRGYLRTADWDAVSSSIALRSPAHGPPKTSAQCRHKMEKLRQRYRTEKQRSLSLTGRFLSSWFFFDNMDSMENGPNQKLQQDGIQSGGAMIRIKTLNDRDLPNSDIGIKNISKKKHGGKSSYDHDGVGMDPEDQNSAILGIRTKSYCPNFDPRTTNMYPSSYVYDASDEDVHLNGKKPGKYQGISRPDFNFSNTINGGGPIVGFSANLPGNHNIVYTAGFGTKKSGKVYVDNPNHAYEQHNGGGDGLCLKISGERISVPSVLRMKNSSDMGDGNPFPSHIVDDRRKMESRGVKRREGCPISEMASSIKMLGEGFLKMEKMKMEMAREVEKARMEMEMKRNEMILESQRQIVDAFLAVLVETKKKKKPAPEAEAEIDS